MMLLGRCVFLTILFSSTLTTYLFEDSAECSVCEPGYYANETVCFNCTAGSCLANSSLCSACVPGTFQNETNATFCYQCVPGTFQNETNATFCYQCEPGTSQRQSNAAKCDDCEPGTFQNESQAVECLPCPPAFYCPEPRMVKPIPCPQEDSCSGGNVQPVTPVTSVITVIPITFIPAHAPCGELKNERSDGKCIYNGSFIAIIVCSFLFGVFVIAVVVVVLYRLVYKSNGYSSGAQANKDKEPLLLKPSLVKSRSLKRENPVYAGL